MSDFVKKYVSTNVKPGAPAYEPKLLAKLYEDVTTASPELKPIAYPLLGAIAVGAHRPDFVPKLFEAAIQGLQSEDAIKTVLNQFKGALTCVWPFIGIPWCVPAQLGLINTLKSRGIEHLALGSYRPPFNYEVCKEEGAIFKDKAYRVVQNKEVQEMLRTYNSDSAELGWTVVFGYCLGGTAKTGLFKDYETQLILASAVAASGATRQARSHGQGAIGMGNSLAAVKALFKAGDELNRWNGVEMDEIDVDAMAKQIEEYLATESTKPQ